jgi:putative SbcD/Mre11-related phosphoesterase
MEIKFLTSEPALLAGKTLFASDIHIGIEREYRLSGLSMPSQTGRLLERMEELLRKTKAKKLVLIGDIKHKVPGTSWQEEREVPVFLQRLAEKSEVHVVPGNHDGGISKHIPKGVALHTMEGGIFSSIYACHGHAWPDPSFLKAKYLLVSHSHPQVEFRDRLGYRWGERVWIRASLDLKRIRAKYHEAREAPELIVMPAFNPLSGGIPVNRKKQPEKNQGDRWKASEDAFSPERHISPILKSAKMRAARIYMLDGTYLGELGKI